MDFDRDELRRIMGDVDINEMAIKQGRFHDGEYVEEDVTAREKAKHIIYDALMNTGYWREAIGDYELGKITPKEQSEIQKHIDKFLDRMIKMLKLK